MPYKSTEAVRRWRLRNPEKVKEQSRRQYLRMTEAQKAKKRLGSRRRYLKNKYGLTEADVNKMKKDQEGCCKICGSSDTFARWRKELVIDHCHDTGTVRGLLCNRCNPHLAWYEEHRDQIKGYLGEV